MRPLIPPMTLKALALTKMVFVYDQHSCRMPLPMFTVGSLVSEAYHVAYHGITAAGVKLRTIQVRDLPMLVKMTWKTTLTRAELKLALELKHTCLVIMTCRNTWY